MRTAICLLLLAFSLASAGEPLHALAPPRIVASTGLTVAASASNPPASIPLDVGKFVFLSVPGVEGPISYYIPPGEEKFVSSFAVAPGGKYPGFHQGDSKAANYTAPTTKTECLMVFGESAGVVTVAVLGINKDGKPAILGTISISVAGARPPPEEEKKKDVTPSPIGQLKKGFVVTLYDDKATDATYAKLIGDTAWKRSLETIPGVLDFRTYDVTLPAADNGAIKKGYLPEAERFLKEKGVSGWSKPVVLFIGENANVADIQFLPPTKPEAETLIRGVIKP